MCGGHPLFCLSWGEYVTIHLHWRIGSQSSWKWGSKYNNLQIHTIFILYKIGIIYLSWKDALHNWYLYILKWRYWPAHPNDLQGIRVASVIEFSVCLLARLPRLTTGIIVASGFEFSVCLFPVLCSLSVLCFHQIF